MSSRDPRHLQDPSQDSFAPQLVYPTNAAISKMWLALLDCLRLKPDEQDAAIRLFFQEPPHRAATIGALANHVLTGISCRALACLGNDAERNVWAYQVLSPGACDALSAPQNIDADTEPIEDVLKLVVGLPADAARFELSLRLLTPAVCTALTDYSEESTCMAVLLANDLPLDERTQVWRQLLTPWICGQIRESGRQDWMLMCQTAAAHLPEGERAAVLAALDVAAPHYQAILAGAPTLPPSSPALSSGAALGLEGP